MSEKENNDSTSGTSPVKLPSGGMHTPPPSTTTRDEDDSAIRNLATTIEQMSRQNDQILASIIQNNDAQQQPHTPLQYTYSSDDNMMDSQDDDDDELSQEMASLEVLSQELRQAVGQFEKKPPQSPRRRRRRQRPNSQLEDSTLQTKNDETTNALAQKPDAEVFLLTMALIWGIVGILVLHWGKQLQDYFAASSVVDY